MKKILILTILFGCLGMQSLLAMQEPQETVLSEQESQDLKSIRRSSLRIYTKVDHPAVFNSLLMLVNAIDARVKEDCGKSLIDLENQGSYDKQQYPKCAERLKKSLETLKAQ